MEKAYGALSKVYEYLICDCDYEKWSQYLLKKLVELNAGNKGIDCACGSGFFTRAIKRGGFDVCGVDFSNEMLNQAVEITAKNGLDITYRQGDMVTLKSFEKVDFITIINDGLNYVSQDKIANAFKSFKGALKKGGLLLFDVSSEYKIRNVLANNMFGEDDENCSYLWFNKLSETYVDMDISLFIREGNSNRFIKREESHRQFIHKTENLKNALIANGFEIVELNAHLGGEIKENSDRIEFVARKI